MAPRARSPLAWARERARAVPPVAWRDRAIARLQEENARLAEHLASSEPVETPSFRQHVHAARRVHAHMRDRNHPDRGNLIARKLKSYSFAQSHGVSIPTIHGLWRTPQEIAWEVLPDRVVIKSNVGSTGRGVVLLHRVDGGWVEATGGEPTSPEAVTERFRRLNAEGRVSKLCFAEELLGAGPDRARPLEVRVSAFYGEVSHLLLRRTGRHGDRGSVVSRRVDVDGSELGGEKSSDGDLPIPASLDQLVEVARRLSACIPHPYVRIDLYDVAGKVVFGELTPRPGSPDGLEPELDARLGRLWEEAEARVLNDVIDGGSYALRFGYGPRELTIGGEDHLPEGVPST